MASYEAMVDILFQWRAEGDDPAFVGWRSADGFVRTGGATRAEAKDKLGDVLPEICRGDRGKMAVYAAWQPIAGRPVEALPQGAEVISVLFATLKVVRKDG